MFIPVRTKSDFLSPPWRLALMASGAGLLAATMLYSRATALRPAWSTFADARTAVMLHAVTLAQDEGGDDEESQIPVEQIEKYVAVYKAMQRNHSLSVDQAAAAQGLSVGAFRDIEGRIERDDLIRERVRQALRPGGEASVHLPGATSPTPAQ